MLSIVGLSDFTIRNVMYKARDGNASRAIYRKAAIA
ncbi:Uncharacterised protein [Bacillus freudenreichii]|nr:Uncharacterised protein [Bacillus freudenreichii]